MIPISGGSSAHYSKTEENIYASLSKADYARNIPRNSIDYDSYIAPRPQLFQVQRIEEKEGVVSSWLNIEHVGQFWGHTFTYRNADIVLPALCILGIGLAIYFW